MKDVLLNRSGAWWLAARKFLYFAFVALIATIPTSYAVSSSFAGEYSPSVFSVSTTTLFWFTWYLFLFLLPWEAYKAIKMTEEYNKLLDKAEQEAAKQQARADAFAHGMKFAQPEALPPVPPRKEFEVIRPDADRIQDARLDWREDFERRRQNDFQGEPEERTQIGFKQGVKARHNETYEQWKNRLNIRG